MNETIPTETNLPSDKKSCNLKSPQSVFNIIIIIALLVLFYLKFSDTNDKHHKTATGAELRIAFVDSDSIMSKYQRFQDLKKELEEETLELSDELRRNEQSLQNAFISYQKKVQTGNISYEDAHKTEERLVKQQEDLVRLSEEYSARIASREYDMSLQVLESVSNTIAELNKANRYDFVLGYTQGAGILFADPKHDITDMIIDTLNKQYRKSKK